MTAFLKKNWPLLAWFVFAGIICFLIMALDCAQDDAMAQIIADRAVAQHRKGREAIIAKYTPLHAALVQQAITLQQGNKALADKVVAKQKALILKDGTLTETRAKLAECSAFLGSISYEYNERLVKADKLRLEQLALKDSEIAEWRARDEASTNTIGQLTKRVVTLTLAKRKRLVVGPQAGYNPLTKQPYIGFGGTYDIGLRFKVPGLF
jgi:hypothetical protein